MVALHWAFLFLLLAAIVTYEGLMQDLAILTYRHHRIWGGWFGALIFLFTWTSIIGALWLFLVWAV